jgi:Uma2 family endonuclease
MSTLPRRSRYTVDQYLAIERASEDRYLYLDGEIYAMAGESGIHGDISVNVLLSLGNQLKGTDCRARTKDTKVRSGPAEPRGPRDIKGMFSYPDVVVICGEPEYHDAHRDVVLNPTAVTEVLSESTEAFDRGEKFTRLQQWNPSLQDYVLVSQDKPQVEIFSRQSDGGWSYHLYAGLDAVVPIPSIKCLLRLADVYDRVTFAEE